MENAPEAFAALPPDTSDVAKFFRKIPLGHPVPDSGSRPMICNVAIGDLDQDPQPDILVCDAQYDVLSWIHQEGSQGVETPLTKLKAPARSEVFDLEGNGDLDIAVALLGQLMPTDALFGQVVLLVNDGRQSFAPFALAKGVPRVAAVWPGDSDSDGDWDFALALLGWRRTGEVAWLEYKSGDQYNECHTLSSKSGCTHMPIGDLNGDEKPDIGDLITQEFEQIVAFINTNLPNTSCSRCATRRLVRWALRWSIWIRTPTSTFCSPTAMASTARTPSSLSSFGDFR